MYALGLPARATVPRRNVCASAQTATTTTKAPGKAADIYIGKGRYVKDDPAKYPDRTIYTGGWAGGEAGLWRFREEVQRERDQPDASSSKPASAKKVVKPAGSTGTDTIYIGKGRYVEDDARKYASRESALTGGFAGGERGLWMFVEKGDLEFLPEGKRRSSPPSLLIAFIVAIVGGAGGLLLQDASGEFSVLVSALGKVDSLDKFAKLTASTPSLQVALALVSGFTVLVRREGCMLPGLASRPGLARARHVPVRV